MTVGQPDLGKDALAVFTAKCVVCHGTQLAKPKGDPPFGYVNDLEELRADTDKVVIGKPDSSNLWRLINAGNMPPPNSSVGQLTAEQRATVRRWIEAGAPVPVVATEESELLPAPATMQGTPTLEESPPVGDTPAPVSAMTKTLVWLGQWHLLLLHFPIALIFAAAIREGWAMKNRNNKPTKATRFCVGMAALFAIPVVVCGWLHAYAGNGAASPHLEFHRWLGVVSAFVLGATGLLSEKDAREGYRRLVTRVLIFSSAPIVGLTAHLGGLMTNGPDFLKW